MSSTEWDDIPANKEDVIIDYVRELNKISMQIAELSRIKEEMDKRLCALFEHGDDYSKTYVAGPFKATVTTAYNYKLNIDEYEIMGSHLPKRFNPVSKKTSYHVDKQVVRDALRYGSEEEVALFNTMISCVPAKLRVSVKAGI